MPEDTGFEHLTNDAVPDFGGGPVDGSSSEMTQNDLSLYSTTLLWVVFVGGIFVICLLSPHSATLLSTWFI